MLSFDTMQRYVDAGMLASNMAPEAVAGAYADDRHKPCWKRSGGVPDGIRVVRS